MEKDVMANIVCALSMSHAPGVLGWPDAPEPVVQERMASAAKVMSHQLIKSKPDVIIAFLDDHFENHFRNLMPALSIGVADAHRGPAKQWLDALQLTEQHEIEGAPEMADYLLHHLIAAEFDVARTGAVEYGNNLMVPLKQLLPACDIAVIPLFINVFSPPLISPNRAYAFGAAVRRAINSYPGEKRVALLATGGLSHWPPVWTDASPTDDEFLQRMRRFQTSGLSVLESDPNLLSDLGRYEIEMAEKKEFPINASHPIINAEWDKRFLQALAQGDTQFMLKLTYDIVQEHAGHGGHEVLNWIALMGAMDGKAATVVDYEPVLEWICGMGYAYYDVKE
jgi:2,3-dihydroxyphenylpropionate 1,2-dioxygenase